jgi:ketosteroid isomerase-like protein
VSQENVEVVRRAYEALNTRDLDVISELGHRDVEWGPPAIETIEGVHLPGAASYRGHLAMACDHRRANGMTSAWS